jgi:hypothetical protein
MVVAAAAATAPSSPIASSMVSRLERELVQVCCTLQKNPVWRVRESYTVFLSRLVGSLLLQCRSAADAEGIVLEQFVRHSLIPLALDLVFDPVKAVRDACCEALVSFVIRPLQEVYYSPAKQQQQPRHLILSSPTAAKSSSWTSPYVLVNEVMWPLIRDHPRAMSTYLMRGALLHAACVLRVDEVHNLLPLLDLLCKDAVPNVRLLAAKTMKQLIEGEASTDRGEPWSGHRQDEHGARGGETGKLSATRGSHEKSWAPLLSSLLDDNCVDVREHAALAFAHCR